MKALPRATCFRVVLRLVMDVWATSAGSLMSFSRTNLVVVSLG